MLIIGWYFRESVANCELSRHESQMCGSERGCTNRLLSLIWINTISCCAFGNCNNDIWDGKNRRTGRNYRGYLSLIWNVSQALTRSCCTFGNWKNDVRRFTKNLAGTRKTGKCVHLEKIRIILPSSYCESSFCRSGKNRTDHSKKPTYPWGIVKAGKGLRSTNHLCPIFVALKLFLLACYRYLLRLKYRDTGSAIIQKWWLCRV